MARLTKLKFITGTILLGLTTACFANVDGDLNHFFTHLGYQVNTTSAGAYHDQAAGYYTGGSLFLRNQVKDYQLASIELPSFSGGCSGIDSFLGSFSVISTTQLTAMMKNIMSAGGSYAFDLALTTAVPQIKTVKDYIQKYVTDINNANINSCNTAEDLVGGMWPKTQSSQQQICRDLGSRNGTFSDWAAARQGCGTGGQFDQGMGDGGDRKQEVIVNKNLIWDALQTNGFSGSDTELSEMLMSLSGSIIIKNDQGKASMTTLMSMADSQDIVKALMYGGSAQIYQCDENKKCLNPSMTTITVSAANGLVAQVTSMIQNLNTAVATDGGTLSDSTRGFLEMTPVPVLKYITNNLELGKETNPAEFSEIIAISLLNQYLSEDIQVVQEALTQEDTPMAPQMAAQITKAQEIIATKMQASYAKLSNIDVLVNNMRANEQQLTSRIADQTSVGQETE
jgi:conjugative transfer pilus assembly protein TraH